MEFRSSNKTKTKYFSICIPQYNRTSFVMKLLKSISEQTFKSFEVCISDGGSNDGRWQEIVDYLENSGMEYVFSRSESNLRYDKNLRASIDLASGRYCFLLANDDQLADMSVLQDLHKQILDNNNPTVVITNYKDFLTNKIIKRFKKARLFGSGPKVAINNFRTYSFVSGVILDRHLSVKNRTEIWDGVEMYQMYLGTRIIASGGTYFGSDIVAVVKDIQIENEQVDSYAKKPKMSNCPVEVRKLPMNGIGELVFRAVEPFIPDRQHGIFLRSIFFQIYVYTYPFWIFEYKRIQSWKFSLGICLAMTPSRILKNVTVGYFTNLYLWSLYALSTTLGLVVPCFIFFGFKPLLYKIAKRGSN
jgi:glycosyltransferase involved in cell wall biosynthesis